MIAFFSDRFGVNVGLLNGAFVIGLVTFPDSIHPVIAARSYEKPSERKNKNKCSYKEWVRRLFQKQHYQALQKNVKFLIHF